MNDIVAIIVEVLKSTKQEIEQTKLARALEVMQSVAALHHSSKFVLQQLLQGHHHHYRPKLYVKSITVTILHQLK